jgi:F-type H+-transporting ATPase subunit c
MNLRTIGLAALSLGVLLVHGSPLLASDPGPGTFYGTAVGCGIGCALTLVGAGIGFGRIGAAALESMARQPEVAGDVGRNMITIAALLEGATFFSLIVCIILAFKS